MNGSIEFDGNSTASGLTGLVETRKNTEWTYRDGADYCPECAGDGDADAE